MKLLLVVLCTLACTLAHPHQDHGSHSEGHGSHGHGDGHGHRNRGANLLARLKWFKTSELSESFQKFEIPESAGCAAEVSTCVKNVHLHAQHCLRMMHRAKGAEMRNCETNEQEVKDADEAWQKASFKWHKAMGQCMAGEDPPAEADDVEVEDMDLFFRKKRDVDEENEAEEECGEEHNYETFTQCWGAMKTHRTRCKAKMENCATVARCNGLGEAPEDATELKWFNYIKKLREDKEAAVRVHKRKLHECLELEESDLWENE